MFYERGYCKNQIKFYMCEFKEVEREKIREYFRQRFAEAKPYSNEAALSLRSRRNGTKLAALDRTAH